MTALFRIIILLLLFAAGSALLWLAWALLTTGSPILGGLIAVTGIILLLPARFDPFVRLIKWRERNRNRD